MTARVRNLLEEIEALSAEERNELSALLQGESNPKFLKVEDAKPLIKEMLTEYSGLFRKLAQ